jgi:hypothetical protein
MTAERFSSRGRGAERRREAMREIREELERVRRSEARVAEALGAARAARQRIEELVRSLALEDEGVRDIVREELRAVSAERPAQATDPADDGAASSLFASRPGDDDTEVPTYAAEDEPEAESAAAAETLPEGHRSLWLVGVAALSVLVVAAVGWLTYQTFNASAEPTLTVGGDSAPPLEGPEAGATGAAEVGAPEGRSAARSEPEDPERFFTLLPESANARAAVYDSLWQAHSAVFSPLLERVEDATEESTLRRALQAWRAGTLTPLQRDLVHSAFVQYSLRAQTGANLALDGQLLRNPCRGASCSALLNFWETRGQSLGLPPVPEDAPRNTAALRMAENVIVLRTLEEVHRERSTNGA